MIDHDWRGQVYQDEFGYRAAWFTSRAEGGGLFPHLDDALERAGFEYLGHGVFEFGEASRPYKTRKRRVFHRNHRNPYRRTRCANAVPFAVLTGILGYLLGMLAGRDK